MSKKDPEANTTTEGGADPLLFTLKSSLYFSSLLSVTATQKIHLDHHVIHLNHSYILNKNANVKKKIYLNSKKNI